MLKEGVQTHDKDTFCQPASCGDMSDGGDFQPAVQTASNGGEQKCQWCVSHVAELPENWTDTRETLLEGMSFQLKYLGVTMVEQPKGEELSAAAVKRIVATVRHARTSSLKSLFNVQKTVPRK